MMKNKIILMMALILSVGCSSGGQLNVGLPEPPDDPATQRFSVKLEPPAGYSYQVPTTFGTRPGPHMVHGLYPGFITGATLVPSDQKFSQPTGNKQASAKGLIQELDGEGQLVSTYECEGSSITGLARVYGLSRDIVISGGKAEDGQLDRSGFVAYVEEISSIKWELDFPEMPAVHDIDSNSDGYAGTGTASNAAKVFRVSLDGGLLWEVSLFSGEGETEDGFPYNQTAEGVAVRLCEDGTVLTVSRIHRSVVQNSGEVAEEGFGIARLEPGGDLLFKRTIIIPSAGTLCVPVDADEDGRGTYTVLTDQLDSSEQSHLYRSVAYELDADGDIISSTVLAVSSLGIYSAGGLLYGHGESFGSVGVSIQDETSADGIPVSDLHWFSPHSVSEGNAQNIGVDDIPFSLCPDGLGGPLAFGLFCDGPTADFPEGRYGAFLVTLL